MTKILPLSLPDTQVYHNMPYVGWRLVPANFRTFSCQSPLYMVIQEKRDIGW